MKSKFCFEPVFRYSAALILLVTAAAKLYSITGWAPILNTDDPLFGIPNRHLLTLVGLLELSVVGVILSTVAFRLKYLLLAWLSASFVIYRIASALLGIGRPCPCLGAITAKLNVKPETVSYLLSPIVSYLFLGSVWLLTSELGARSSHDGSIVPEGFPSKTVGPG